MSSGLLASSRIFRSLGRGRFGLRAIDSAAKTRNSGNDACRQYIATTSTVSTQRYRSHNDSHVPSPFFRQLTVNQVRWHSSMSREHSNLLRNHRRLGFQYGQQASRSFLGVAGRALLKVRYWLLGGAIGGGAYASQKYDEWRDRLPDLSWVNELVDSSQLEELGSRWRNSIQSYSGQARAYGHDAGQFLRTSGDSLSEWLAERIKGDADGKQSYSILSAESGDEESFASLSEQERIQKLRDEMLDVQSQYQREVERLEKENKELKRQLLLKTANQTGKRRKVKESLIDMYSEVLDSLAAYDCSYNVADNLPRVVVVGDQSSGKTSVLEMIAQARIFPRGAGEMMTRAPVKVTLSEGPYHIAQFKDSTREFDLSKEADLDSLRKEVEIRMKNSVKSGKTVSNEVIALTVKGPRLPRMVLVDLPGVISTVTTEMAKDTKDDIARMCRTHMENPNAIILCIQDGSVDAERSNVTDMVSAVDPKGKRTIMVLTKVDLAEENLANPDRIKKILAGKLFPMKTVSNFAVVTGRGSSQDSIESIRKYEETFFARSKLFRDGILKPSQMSTQNMSMAVSQTFWKMVKASIAEQADAFRAARYNLETEWKNTFPRQRQLDRDELYDKARCEILDEIVSLSQVGTHHWEEVIMERLWDRVSPYVFDNIYLPAALVESAGSFNTVVDIKLKHWADKELANKCIQTGWETLKEQFLKQVEEDERTRHDHDDVFSTLKKEVIDTAMNAHSWDGKALDYLRVIQLSHLEDHDVPNKAAWLSAASFMENSIKKRQEATSEILKNLRGPSGFYDTWINWSSPTEEQKMRQAAESELRRILKMEPEHKPSLNADDMTVVRRNLESIGVTSVPEEILRTTWHHVYREHFLEKALQASRECKHLYYHYKQGFPDKEVDCQAVPLFWRVQKMLLSTSNSLRQQITNNEQRRLEKEIKDVLEDWSQDSDVKRNLLTGRRVELSEELKQVRDIQEKLEEFVEALKNQKSE